jgi:hypothetical protein
MALLSPFCGMLADKWRPNRVAADTRLAPEGTDRARFRFRRTDGPVTVVARLIYRRFSKHLADQKGWPDNECVIVTARCCWPRA